jgi:DNA-binding NarL/FixJ family response regulator
MMDDLTNPALLLHESRKSPVLAIIEHHMLARTCILSMLRRELPGFEIVEMATTAELSCVSERDVRLVALNIRDKPIVDPSVEDELTLLERSCPNASIALLSSRDDEATASAAMQRGVRGFFPTSIPVEVAIAGLRLVLAGGVYRPLPILKETDTPGFDTTRAYLDVTEEAAIHHVSGISAGEIRKPMIDLTPREQHVLAGLELGLPNKLIAARLSLSENTVKMHIQHIMRKCSAHNRTEAVLRCNGRLPRLVLSRVSSSG